MRVELHPEADDEFSARVAYYNRKQPGLGGRFYREVIATLEWIAANPEVPRLRRNYRRVNLRVFPFYVAYVLEADLVVGACCGARQAQTSLLESTNAGQMTGDKT